MKIGKAGWQRRRQIAAGQDDIANGRIVGRKCQCAADMVIVGWRHLGVELQVESRRRVFADNVEAAHVFQRLVGLRRLILAGHRRQLAGCGQRTDGRFVIGDDPAHFVDRTFAKSLVVVGVALDSHLGAAVPIRPALYRRRHRPPSSRDKSHASSLPGVFLDDIGIDDEHRKVPSTKTWREGFRQGKLPFSFFASTAVTDPGASIGEQIGWSLIDL